MARVLPCVEVAELLTAYLDDALPRRLRRAVVRHLAGCADCTRLLLQLLDVVRRLAALHEPGLRPTVRRSLRAAFRSRVTDPAVRRLRP
jgi:anti-sigma factor RsiW